MFKALKDLEFSIAGAQRILKDLKAKGGKTFRIERLGEEEIAIIGYADGWNSGGQLKAEGK